jgi:DNA polymerase
MRLSREQMLVEMGLGPIWRERTQAPLRVSGEISAGAGGLPPPQQVPENPPDLANPVPALVAAADPAHLEWPELAQHVGACRACGLCQQRKQAVLGVGDRQADWLFVGEGPGAEEDVQGEPFVGQAGKLLDNMLAALDLKRDHKVYIANAVKCRPPGNRTPEAAEMAACRPYLARQIALIQPKIIVLLGKAAAYAVLHEDKTLAAMRGQHFAYQGIPVVVTYHPSYLLRNLPDKAKAWEDLLRARQILRATPTS